MPWPTETLTINGRFYWGHVYDVRTGGEFGRLLDEETIEQVTATARADVRNGSASVGERLLEHNGRSW